MTNIFKGPNGTAESNNSRWNVLNRKRTLKTGHLHMIVNGLYTPWNLIRSKEKMAFSLGLTLSNPTSEPSLGSHKTKSENWITFHDVVFLRVFFSSWRLEVVDFECLFVNILDWWIGLSFVSIFQVSAI